MLEDISFENARGEANLMAGYHAPSMGFRAPSLAFGRNGIHYPAPGDG
jgi:hypothetical protein